MSATATRAWYWAIGVNCATAVTSPAAQMPGAEVRRCSSTVIPLLVVATPAASRSSSSTFGTRPDASSNLWARRSYGSEPSRGAIVATTSSPSWRTRWTKTFDVSSIPSACNAAASVAEASASASGASRSAASTRRTWAPKRENICPNSSPTAPHPTTSSERGTSVKSSAEMWSSQSISSIPSTGGTAVREPVATRIRSASSSRSPTRSVRGPMNVACPVTAVMPELFEVAQPLFLRALQRLLPLADAGEVDPRRARLDPEHRRARG